MARIVLLANSKRPDGQCLGGIDLDTNEWVRPVPKMGDGIPIARCFVGRRFLATRDVVEIDLARPGQPHKYQRENRIILNWKWRLIKRLNRAALEKYVEDATPVLHSKNDRVAPAALERLACDDWKSLQLIRPRNLGFRPHAWDPHRWVAHFDDSKGNHYSIKVTDPEATRRLEAGEAISERSLLTVSMTKPWTSNEAEKSPMCYKVVAAVIELG